ncbi:MAG: FAD-dependent oxidoreductase [Actinobacteria bacterium]|nr:FAD-dependent oxidoreductase [Actinomycetota bacterium]
MTPLVEETPDLDGAFPRLDARQIAVLATYGEERSVAEGTVLFRPGDRFCDFYVILEGRVALVEGEDEGADVVAVHGPGRFLGELSQLTGQTSFLGAVACEPTRVLAVPVERLRAVVTRDAELGDLILRAYLVRRCLLIEMGTGLRIIGSRFSPDTRRLREFAARNRLPHRWIDLEEEPGAEGLLRSLGVTPEETPVVILGGTVLLRNPDNAELARAIGLSPPTGPETVLDLLIVGAGPAGLAAAVYGASEGLGTVALDAIATGGQAATSSLIENYLGFPAGVSGGELAERAEIQAEKFGAHLTVPAQACGLDHRDGLHIVRLADAPEAVCRALIVASGVHYRRLPAARLEDFEGISVYYAATLVEGQLCAGDPIAVVGGGNSAGQATVFLAPRVPKVRLIVRENDLAAGMSRYLADRIERTPNVEVLLHTEVKELVGDVTLQALVLEDNHTGARQTVDARALFVFIGADPHTRWLGDQIALDDRGYVLTGPAACDGSAWTGDRPPMPLETSRPGVFAAGDIRSGSIKRVASAVGEGSMAVQMVHQHLAGAPRFQAPWPR